MKDQEKHKFLYLHVFMVPLELWLDKYRFAYNNAVLESPSAGFIRIPPGTPLIDVRNFINDQLGNDVIPTDFIFLRSVGRCLAIVNENQELKMKIDEFVPPSTYSPELFLLPCKHENIFTAANSSTEEFIHNNNIPSKNPENSCESTDDVPFSSLRNNGVNCAYQWQLSNNDKMIPVSAIPDTSPNSEESEVRIYRKKQLFKPLRDSQKVNSNSKDFTQNGDDRKNKTRPFSTLTFTGNNEPYKPDPKRDSLTVESAIKRCQSVPSLKSKSSTITQLLRPEIALITTTSSVNFPLPSAKVILSISKSSIKNHSIAVQPNLTSTSIQESEDKSFSKSLSIVSEESTGKPAISSPLNQQRGSFINIKKLKMISGNGDAILNNVQLSTDGIMPTPDETDRRSALQARVMARFEKEQKRLQEEKALDKDISEETQKKLLKQMEEFHKKNNMSAVDNNTENNMMMGNRAEDILLSKSKMIIDDAKKKKHEDKKLRELKEEKQERLKTEMQEQKKSKIEELKKTLEETKIEKHALQRTRELNGKRLRVLQTELNNKNIQKANVWKKHFEEEKRQTIELEETLKKLKLQMKKQHQKLVTHSSSQLKSTSVSKTKDQQQRRAAPSQRTNQRNMVLRFQNEIEDLKMMVDLTTKKLTAESKMKSFAQEELKDLRTKALESKINAARVKKTLSPQGTT